jgi:hypothetical protein
MDSTLLHPLPRRDAVVREQLRTVGLSLRREGLLAAGGLGALSAWILSVHLSQPWSGPRISLVPDAMVPAVLLALFAALAVWKGEDPARRGYHWSMPVDHADHAMAKTFSGWAWLVAAVGGYVAWLAVMAVATGGELGVETRWGTTGKISETVAGWRWMVPFAGATILYLFGTALALASRHPWRWLGGGAVAFVFMAAWAASIGGRTPLHELIETLWVGEYGLRTAITGLSPDRYEETSHGLFYLGSYGLEPAFGGWVSAAALWLAGALGAATLAAHRQPRG